jgi:NTE family protein
LQIEKKIPSIGIAFGGGAARGFAHIGVLESLHEAGDTRLLPRLIAGTSVGSIVGALYAAGLSVEAIEQSTRSIGWTREVVDVTSTITESMQSLTGLLLPGGLERWLRETVQIEFDKHRGGVLSTKGLDTWINRLIAPQRSFDDLEKSLAVVATDIERKERVVFTAPEIRRNIQAYFGTHPNRFVETRLIDDCSSVALAVRASSAIPVIFESVKNDGRRLVDGGILDQVPVEIARAMGADIVIGVSLGFSQVHDQPIYPHQLLSNMMDLMTREGIARSLSMADVAIEIRGIEKTSLIDMEQRKALMALGKTAMQAKIPHVRRLVDAFGNDHGRG